MGEDDIVRELGRLALLERLQGELHAVGLGLQAIGLAWIAAVSEPTVGYGSFVGPFILSGIGMGMFFAPVANIVLSAVRRDEEGKASGANNAIREVGGVLGVAVLASIFARYGGYESSQTFNDGLVPAIWVGAVVVGVGALLGSSSRASASLPRRRSTSRIASSLRPRPRSSPSRGTCPGPDPGHVPSGRGGTVAAMATEDRAQAQARPGGPPYSPPVRSRGR